VPPPPPDSTSDKGDKGEKGEITQKPKTLAAILRQQTKKKRLKLKEEARKSKVDLEKIAKDRRQHVQAMKLARLDKKKHQQQLKDVIRRGTQNKSFVQQETRPLPSVTTRTKNKKKENKNKMSLFEFLNIDLSGQLSGGPGHTPYGMYT
jgi:hypothetical protein